MFNKAASCKHAARALPEARFGGKVYGWQRADGERPDSRRPGAGDKAVSATDPGDGNRLIFKPSPLAGLKKTAPAQGGAPAAAVAGPLEVTAVPLTRARAAEAPPPPAMPPRPQRPDRDDHTTISFEPLGSLPSAAETPQRQAPAETPQPKAPTPAEEPDRTGLYLLVALAAAAILYYLYSQGLLR